MRNFRVSGIKIRIVNRYTAGMEINSFNQKYDVMIFNTAYNAWTRLCSCMTIADGKGFLSALEIVSGYEDKLIFIGMDHFNTYVYSAKFMLA